MRDMSNTYRHMSIFELMMLWSKKQTRARKLEKSYSYLDQQELRNIRFNVKQIEAEIAAKEAQLALFE